jgi:hypothetical protein
VLAAYAFAFFRFLLKRVIRHLHGDIDAAHRSDFIPNVDHSRPRLAELVPGPRRAVSPPRLAPSPKAFWRAATRDASQLDGYGHLEPVARRHTDRPVMRRSP